MSSKVKSQAILLLSDKNSPIVYALYKELQNSVSENSDVLVAFHQKEKSILPSIESANLFVFSDDILFELGYHPIGENLVPGNNHFPLFKFYKINPDYDYYWVIEDDVRFKGNWDLFFNSFQSITCDLLTCCIRHYQEEPYWYWWELMHPCKKIPLENRIRSFNPIYRISKAALKFMDMNLLDGWCGHHEVIFTTLLQDGGYVIWDFGGDGKFVLPGFKNKFYISNAPNAYGSLHSGTMRYRPIFDKTGKKHNKLYHPVKDINQNELLKI